MRTGLRATLALPLAGLLTALSAAAAGTAPATPPGTVVLGTSTIDGTQTELVLVAPDETRATVGVLEHAPGHLPKGILVGDRLLTVSVVPDESGAVLEETLLSAPGARRLLATDVVGSHAPTVDDAGRVLFVRRIREGQFHVVRLSADGTETVIAKRDASWLTPARGKPATFLEVGDGTTRLVTLTAGKTIVVAELGPGAFRAAAFAPGGALVERGGAQGKAEVLSVGGNAPARRGLAGMDPLACGDGVVLGSGEKRASVVFARMRRGALVDTVSMPVPSAGVATPRACTLVNRAPVAVVSLDRGASLPPTLWRATPRAATRLLAPEPGLAFEVYGVVAGGAP